MHGTLTARAHTPLARSSIQLLCTKKVSGVKAVQNGRAGKRTDAIRAATDAFSAAGGSHCAKGGSPSPSKTQHYIAPVHPADAAAEAAAIAYYASFGFVGCFVGIVLFFGSV